MKFELLESLLTEESRESLFLKTITNRKGFWNRLMFKGRGLSTMAATKGLADAGFSPEEITKARAEIKNITQKLANKKGWKFRAYDQNFNGFIFDVLDIHPYPDAEIDFWKEIANEFKKTGFKF